MRIAKKKTRKTIFFLSFFCKCVAHVQTFRPERKKNKRVRISHGDVTVNSLAMWKMDSILFSVSFFVWFLSCFFVSRLLPPSVRCHKLLNSYLLEKFYLETCRSCLVRAPFFVSNFLFSRTTPSYVYTLYVYKDCVRQLKYGVR